MSQQKNTRMLVWSGQRFAWQVKYFWFNDLCSCNFLIILVWHSFCCCSCTFLPSISICGNMFFLCNLCDFFYYFYIYVHYYLPLLRQAVHWKRTHSIIILCFRGDYSFCAQWSVFMEVKTISNFYWFIILMIVAFLFHSFKTTLLKIVPVGTMTSNASDR